MGDLLNSFYKDKNIFITGHTGFKGSWMSIWLESLGANLTGYSNEIPTSPSLYSLTKLKDRMNAVSSDIRDIEKLKNALIKSNPEIIFHFAAQSLVRKSYNDPINTFTTNIMGTVNLLEIAREMKNLKAIIVVTSDKCYHNNESIWGYRETDPLGGHDPYSASKGCVEILVSSYQSSFFNDFNHNALVASVRAGNVIGGGDWSQDRIIPDLIKSFINNKPVKIRNLNAIRPWQHVLEPLLGYLMLAKKLYEKNTNYAESWNFGPIDNDSKSVKWIVEKSIEIWGGNSSWLDDRNVNNPHEAKYLKLDSSKAISNLNWNPKWNAEETLLKTIRWYKSYHESDQNKIDLYKLCLDDIRSYTKK